MGRAYIGVEPNVRCLAYLSEVIASNSLTDTTIIPIGASNQAGLLPLFLQCGSSTDPTASLREDLRPGLQRRVEWINAAPLDDVLSTIKSPPISTVKIDVEGFELEALSGMTRILSTDRPTILCEVLLADAKADLAAYGLRMAALGALLKKHDYQLHRIVISKTGTLESVDAINAFPVGYWSEALKDACDYVFAPVEFSLSGIEAER